MPNLGCIMAARVPGCVESHIRTQINLLLWHYYWIEPCSQLLTKIQCLTFGSRSVLSSCSFVMNETFVSITGWWVSVSSLLRVLLADPPWPAGAVTDLSASPQISAGVPRLTGSSSDSKPSRMRMGGGVGGKSPLGCLGSGTHRPQGCQDASTSTDFQRDCALQNWSDEYRKRRRSRRV